MRYRVVAPNKVISSSDCDGPIYESECFAILSKFDDLSFRHLADISDLPLILKVIGPLNFSDISVRPLL